MFSVAPHRPSSHLDVPPVGAARFFCAFALLSLGIAAFILAATEARAELAGSKPNIIIVLTDDQGYGDVACLGNPIIKTPHLDRLHGESLRLTNFHVSPTCAPTRSAMLTGNHEFKNGVTHTILERERLSLKSTTFPSLLKTAGYTTGIFGKWHLGDEHEYWPSQRGFDEQFTHGAGGIGQSYPGSCGDAPGNEYFDPAIMHNGKFVKTKGYCTDIFFDQAMKWITEKSTAKASGKTAPFYCHIATNAPHGPLICPPDYEAMYTGKVNANVAKFYGMITNIDDNVGKLVAKLKELDIERDTLLIFMTDNGTATGAQVFNAGMRGTKGSPYEGGTRVPSFWRWPGKLPAGVDANQLTSHIDYFPTFLALAGVKHPDGLKIDGRSLMPILENAKADWPDRALVTHVGRWPRGKAADAKFSNMSIRNSQFALVNNKELFDLKADYGQKTNVIDDHPKVVEQLRKTYDAWWDQVLPLMVNEDLDGPKVNPFHELYWKQFPDEKPQGKTKDDEKPKGKGKKKAA